MILLCLTAFAGAFIVAVFAVADGQFSYLLAMPLVASTCAIASGVLLVARASLRSRHGVAGAPADSPAFNADELADALSQQLRARLANRQPVRADRTRSDAGRAARMRSRAD